MSSHCHGVRLSGLRAMLLSASLLAGAPPLVRTAQAQTQPNQNARLATGQFVTPLAAPDSIVQPLNPGLPDHLNYLAGQAIKTVISPDGTTLLVLTSGYNNLNVSAQGAELGNFEPSASHEYVFVYDITGKNAESPLMKQVIKIRDTFLGLVFSPDGKKFYVSGGVDDFVYTYTNGPSGWSQTARVSMGYHVSKTDPVDIGGIGFYQSPSVANLALTADGQTLVAVNIYDDSISVIDTASDRRLYNYDLRPYNTSGKNGEGVAGGETPIDVKIAGTTAYISSVRDRQVLVLDISGTQPTLIKRIPLPGNPNSMIFDNQADPAKLYVAQDNSDYIAVINLADNTIVEQIDAIAPAGTIPETERYTGAAPNSLAITPNGKTLLVTNGGQNAISVILLKGPIPHKSVGLIPTAWYPQSVSISNDGKHVYVVNSKSKPGPNLLNLSDSTYALIGTHYKGGNQAAQNTSYAANEYVFQIEPAGLMSFPLTNAVDPAELAILTAQVAKNNLYSRKEKASDIAMMAGLHSRIHHIIYIVKENRTYDQVLGDLKNGANGDPYLTVFGQRVTPNFHHMSEDFVTLDNFYDPAEVSGNGWEWSTAARETDLNVKQIPLDYAASPKYTKLNQGYRGAPYNAEGQNNDVDVGRATTAQRTEAQPLYVEVTKGFPGGTKNFLPGTNNDAAPDGPDDAKQMGYLWDSAVHGGITIRNYGYFIDLGGSYANVPNPYQLGDVEAYSTNPTLLPVTDPYFRSFDNNYPDYWRLLEWQREFNQFVANKDLPQLEFVRFMHDHMGDFKTAVGNINVPERQQADDDYAVGLLVDTIAHSPYKDDTLVFVVEDDSQDGPDHVDDHRSTAYIVGPYVKHRAVDSTYYTTVNMLRTIEDILGIDHMNLNDAYAEPMADVFDLAQKDWTFKAKASPYLKNTVDTGGDNLQYSDDQSAVPTHDAAWWAAHTAGYDWSKEDRVPAQQFNRVLWEGLKGTPYTSGRDQTK